LTRAHRRESERLHVYIHFSNQFFETRPGPVQKRSVLSYRLKGEAQPDDVVALQFDVQTWTEHLISLNAKFSRLNNAMRLEVADSFVEIFSSMRELQVSKICF
jgi:hypothetical protein